MNLTSLTNFILLTIDVEDWFQVENFKQYIPFSSWPGSESRVERNTHRILDLLDSIKLKTFPQLSDETCLTEATNSTPNGPCCVRPVMPHRPSSMSYQLSASPRATFFILGWIAERLPHLVCEIKARGHEVASHGYYHMICGKESSKKLRKDLIDSKKLLEDLIGSPVCGYRAPSFSIDQNVLKLLEDCGYVYDSSFNSFGMNNRHGHLELTNNRRRGIALQLSRTLYELPISNLKLGTKVVPWGGGGYFRLIPLRLFNIGVRSILKKEKAYLFYIHPWEMDPEQPKVNGASPLYRFRHYVNLDKTVSKLSSFIETFKECRFITCHEYLQVAQSQLYSKDY